MVAPTRFRTSAVALATILAAVAAAGCDRTTIVGARRTLHVAVTEYRLLPDRFSARSGRLTLIVRNVGLLTHDLWITRGSTRDHTPPIAPGQTAQLTVHLRPGTYTIASEIQSDQALGAYGTLKVTRRISPAGRP